MRNWGRQNWVADLGKSGSERNQSGFAGTGFK